LTDVDEHQRCAVEKEGKQIQNLASLFINCKARKIRLSYEGRQYNHPSRSRCFPWLTTLRDKPNNYQAESNLAC
jgi:hypothetical protein